MYFAVLRIRRIIFVSAIVIISVVFLVFTNLYLAQEVFVKQEKMLPIYSVETSEKKLAISFDCAWGTDYTDKLLEIMDEEGVKCTFFAVEFWTKKHPDYIKKISDYGHEIGTHSSTHPYMSKLSKSQIEKELTSSSNAIYEITGKKVELFRAPYGDYNDLLINTAKELSLFTIQWSVDSLDWKDLSAKEIYNRVITKVKSGSIVLFHNQGLHTADALRDIIRKLKSEGYEFCTIGELIYRENFTIRSDGTQVGNS